MLGKKHDKDIIIYFYLFNFAITTDKKESRLTTVIYNISFNNCRSHKGEKKGKTEKEIQKERKRGRVFNFEINV